MSRKVWMSFLALPKCIPSGPGFVLPYMGMSVWNGWCLGAFLLWESEAHTKWEAAIWAMFFSCWSAGAQKDRTTVHAHLKLLLLSRFLTAHWQNKHLANPIISRAGKYALSQGGGEATICWAMIQFITANLKAKNLIKQILKLSVSVVLLQFLYRTFQEA